MISRRAWMLALVAAACGSKRHAHDDAAPKPAVDAAVHRDARRSMDAAPPARVEHAVWKLVDNRHAAHRVVDREIVIDAGDIGFARYIRFGVPVPHWHLGKTIDGERAAVADRLASIELPLAHDQIAATQLTIHVHGEAKQ